MLGLTLRQTSILSSKEQKYFWLCHATETEISSTWVDHSVAGLRAKASKSWKLSTKYNNIRRYLSRFIKNLTGKLSCWSQNKTNWELLAA